MFTGEGVGDLEVEDGRVGIVFTTNNANKRVGPTLTSTNRLEHHRPSTSVLFVNAGRRVRSGLMPTTNFTFGAVRVANFREGFSTGGVTGGVGALFLVVDSSERIGGVVGRFGPSIMMNFNKCIDNPIIEATYGLNMGATVRRRGTCPNIAGGTLTGAISGIVLAIGGTRRRLRYGGRPMIAKLPMEGRVVRTSERFSHTGLNISPSDVVMLSVNNDLNTGTVGRGVATLVTRH